MHARRQGAADHRHSRQARALYERRAVPPLHPHRDVAAGRPLRVRRLRQLAGAQILARTASCCSPGASPAPIPASSTSPTTSAATPTAGSMSPTAKTTGSRCSTATANTRRSGTTCTAPPACTWKPARRRPRFYVGEIGPDMAVNIDLPNCGPRVSIYSHKGELLAGSAMCMPGSHRPVHLAARPRRRLARRHLCRRGLLHQLGPPGPRQGRGTAARSAQPAKAG